MSEVSRILNKYRMINENSIGDTDVTINFKIPADTVRRLNLEKKINVFEPEFSLDVPGSSVAYNGDVDKMKNALENMGVPFSES